MRPCLQYLLAVLLLPGSIHAQSVTARPRSGSEAGEAPAPPLVEARPDVALRDGEVSVGSFGKLVAARSFEMSPELRSSFEGSVCFASPGERADKPGLRRGFVRWSLRSRGGATGEVGLLGDPLVQTLRSSLEAPLPGAVHVSAAAESRWTRQAWGAERVVFARLGLRRSLPGVVVQPSVHVVDVASRADVRWFGTGWRLDCRGAELGMQHDFGRQRTWWARRAWRRSGWQAILGGQRQERAGASDRHLLEIGAGVARVLVRGFPSRDQQAFLLETGPVQIGYGRRAARRQFVLGVRSLSLSCFETPGGREFGLGFVFGGWARRLARSHEGWLWAAPLHANALAEPHLRWPGFATRLE